jgi:hypothetical protein
MNILIVVSRKSEVIVIACLAMRYTMKKIGYYFDVHYVMVSRVVKLYKCKTWPLFTHPYP